MRKLKTFNDILTDTLKKSYRDTKKKYMLDTTSKQQKIQHTGIATYLRNTFCIKGHHTPAFCNGKNIRGCRKPGNKQKIKPSLPKQIQEHDCT